MGQTAENVALFTGISREDQDHWGVRSQNRAEDAIKSGFFEREIVPVTLPDGTTVTTDDGPRAGTTYEKISQLKPVFRPNGTITAGNACPLNDGAAAVVIMSDTKAKELGLTPLARIVSTGVSGLSPEIMGLGPIEAIKKALGQGGQEDLRHRPGRDQRGVRRSGARLGAGARHRRGQAERVRRRDRARPPVRHDGRPHHRHAAEQPGDVRQDVRHRVDVRRRRPGHGDGRGAALLALCVAIETAVRSQYSLRHFAICTAVSTPRRGATRRTISAATAVRRRTRTTIQPNGVRCTPSRMTSLEQLRPVDAVMLAVVLDGDHHVLPPHVEVVVAA